MRERERYAHTHTQTQTPRRSPTHKPRQRNVHRPQGSVRVRAVYFPRKTESRIAQFAFLEEHWPGNALIIPPVTCIILTDVRNNYRQKIIMSFVSFFVPFFCALSNLRKKVKRKKSNLFAPLSSFYQRQGKELLRMTMRRINFCFASLSLLFLLSVSCLKTLNKRNN